MSGVYSYIRNCGVEVVVLSSKGTGQMCAWPPNLTLTLTETRKVTWEGLYWREGRYWLLEARQRCCVLCFGVLRCSIPGVYIQHEHKTVALSPVHEGGRDKRRMIARTSTAVRTAVRTA